MNPPTQPEHFRLFVAIAVPETVKSELHLAQEELRRAVPGEVVRWTKPAQMHLTLRFLGNVNADRVAGLVEALHRACSGFAPLELRAEGIGFFPDQRRPRVVWAGIRDVGSNLSALQQAVETATKEFTAEPPEKKFTGHLTLGRIKFIRRPEADALDQVAKGSKNRCFGKWTATSVELVRSQLSSDGARYSTVARIELKGHPAS